jgi:hypothetical protein
MQEKTDKQPAMQWYPKDWFGDDMKKDEEL